MHVRNIDDNTFDPPAAKSVFDYVMTRQERTTSESEQSCVAQCDEN